MACSVKVLKYLLLICETIYGVTGILIVILAVITRRGVYLKIPLEFEAVLEVIFALGGAMFFITVAGCFSILKENCCFLKTFAIILYILSILVALLAATTFVTKSYFLSNSEFKQDFTNDMVNTIFVDTQTVDKVQTAFHCCGVSGPSYWKTTELPSSCCKNETSCNINSPDLYNEDCFTAFVNFLTKCLDVVGSVTIVIALLGFVAAGAALFLANSVHDEDIRATLRQTSIDF